MIQNPLGAGLVRHALAGLKLLIICPAGAGHDRHALESHIKLVNLRNVSLLWIKA